MNCINCGQSVDTGLAYCPNCGTPVPKPKQYYTNPKPVPPPQYQQPQYQQPQYQQPQYQQPQYQQPQYQQPVYGQPQATYGQQPGGQPQYGQVSPPPQVTYRQSPYNVPRENPVLILVFGIVGLASSFWPVTSIAGIVFSAIAMHKGKNYLRYTPNPDPKARAGRGLAIAGLVTSIIFTLIWFCVLGDS